MKKKKYILAADIGGTKISLALATKKGKIIEKNTTLLKKPYKIKNFLDNISDNIDYIVSKKKISKKDISIFSLAVAGHINPEKGIVYCSPNLPFINKKNIKNLISRKTGLKVIIENDANAAALGEYLFGAGKNCSSFIYITVSTGIGGGLIINGEIHHGAHFLAGEIGHMSLDILNGPICRCKDKGCYEALASGTALGQRARQYFGNQEILKLANGKINNITSKIINEAAKKNDKYAKKLIKDHAWYIAQGLINLIKIIDPHKIIIGGGLSNMGPLLFNEIRKEVKKSHMLKNSNTFPKIVPSGLKTDEGLIGAIALGVKHL